VRPLNQAARTDKVVVMDVDAGEALADGMKRPANLVLAFEGDGDGGHAELSRRLLFMPDRCLHKGLDTVDQLNYQTNKKSDELLKERSAHGWSLF
jgi:hypothetical protein